MFSSSCFFFLLFSSFLFFVFLFLPFSISFSLFLFPLRFFVFFFLSFHSRMTRHPEVASECRNARGTVGLALNWNTKRLARSLARSLICFHSPFWWSSRSQHGQINLATVGWNDMKSTHWIHRQKPMSSGAREWTSERANEWARWSEVSSAERANEGAVRGANGGASGPVVYTSIS